ncbi:MAG: transglycosylase domain-containing protein [Candidatus Binatia bacterium]
MLLRPSVASSSPPLAVETLRSTPARWYRGLARLSRFGFHTLPVYAGLLLGAVIVYELQTSALQARLLSRYATDLTYHVEAGSSPRIAFPQSGPLDQRRGYSEIPMFVSRLQAQGFQVARQARISPELAQLMRWGVTPPYPEPAIAGLTVRGADGTPLYEGVDSKRVFRRFEEIPPLLVQTLLFIENRELLRPFDPRSNPVIEWDRLVRAVASYGGSRLGLPIALEGGSTLATQLEKYRHSPGGRTGTATEKLRQMLAASLKAYADGPDTRKRRRQIVVDYLNTLPLAAAPGYGELYGIGDGLYAWFGRDLSTTSRALWHVRTKPLAPETVRAYKHVLALLIAVRAPTTYLVEARAALNGRVNGYTRLLEQGGVISSAMARAVRATPIAFLSHAPVSPPPSYVHQKAPNSIRTSLMQRLGVASLYDLDRLQLEVDSTIDAALQSAITALLEHLAEPEFIATHHLNGKRLLHGADPRKVLYSLILFERTVRGNVLRVQADSLNRPFDLNEGIKMELGSTAKLRTLAHYLELVAKLYREFSALDAAGVSRRVREARDPITRWVAKAMLARPNIDLYTILQRALDRRYSASPAERFFTGGALHTFHNFNAKDDRRVMSVRTALRHSVNLVFIRLMHDLVRFHEARLPYDRAAVLADTKNPDRHRLLVSIAESTAKKSLARAYRRYRGLSEKAIVATLLRKRARSARHLAMLFFAWHPGADGAALRKWLTRWLGSVSVQAVERLKRAYGRPGLTLSDSGYLLARRPLEVWCAGVLARDPGTSWKTLLARSVGARQVTSAWLFQRRNRRAQDRRLWIRIEQDAFARMTPYWQRLGFPFARLVPSYATAIGNSSDRPAALAELMGIIVNGGVRQPLVRVTQLQFATGTPYETTVVPAAQHGKRVMELAVARALRAALAGVVQGGTARRVAGVFVRPDGTPVVTGGKTGSGDNRFKTFNRHGDLTSARAVNRTAAFVFYIGERYFGVLTAFVPGRGASRYTFTSALPLSVLKLAAPTINRRL